MMLLVNIGCRLPSTPPDETVLLHTRRCHHVLHHCYLWSSERGCRVSRQDRCQPCIRGQCIAATRRTNPHSYTLH